MSKIDDAAQRATNRLARLEREIAETRVELEVALRRKKYPDFDELNDSTVIAFSLQLDTFGGIRKTYHYAARKVMRRWYTTGSTCPQNGYSAEQLCTFLDGGTLVGKIKELS